MTTMAAYYSVEQYPEKLSRTAQRILDTLDRGESRLHDHYSQVRGHQRTTCRKVINVRIPQIGGPPQSFSVYMRDVSSGGAGFIYPGHIPEEKVMIGIPIPGRDDTWFEGKIVRRKEYIQEGFWDYGVKFTDRLT
ncbi:MAG: PilZ domain-containing protein [Planctomycetaceae bacterium]|nr:PilZ domain-containing protein [Planctomycetaceae bacterium]